jgi:hypothetical protein
MCIAGLYLRPREKVGRRKRGNPLAESYEWANGLLFGGWLNEEPLILFPLFFFPTHENVR